MTALAKPPECLARPNELLVVERDGLDRCSVQEQIQVGTRVLALALAKLANE